MQSGTAAPQPTPNSLPPLPVPTQPATAMATQAELEAAIAALADKKRRLREAFDRLVACSPVPVPFRWEDLDAYLASVAASFGFPHLDSVLAEAIAGAAAAAADAGGPTTAAHHVEHPDKEEQDRERRVGRSASEEGHGINAEEGEEGGNASLHQERGEEKGEEPREPSCSRSDREADEAGNILGVEAVTIEAAPEQVDDGKEEDAMGAIVASPDQRDDDIEMVVVGDEGAVNASADTEGRDDEDEAEEGECLQHPHAACGGEMSALAPAVAAACAIMDPSTLVDALCLGDRSSLRAFVPALLGAPDPHALLVRAVGGFLDVVSTGPGHAPSEWWANCVSLIECAPRLAAPSLDAMAQAKRLAGHWKEMVVSGPAGAGGGGRDMGGMAGWGLLTFIASYNIVPEFDADEIIRLFGDIAPQVKDNCVELCKRLGLIGKMTDSINRFIENGQLLDAIRLAHTFSLTDKYPPLTIMNDYVENAKKAAEDILSKESYTLESLNQAMAKKVDALIFSWSAVDGCDIDSVQRNSIKEEITQLLHKYAYKQQSLAGVSASISSSHQQQNFQEEYQQRPQMRLVEQQNQQGKPHELQQKPEDKEHQQQKPQETQHRHIQNQQEPQEREMWQNRKRKRPNKNRKRKQRRQKLQQQQNKRPRLPPYVRPGIDNRQPFSGTRRAPFAPYTTTIPRYFWSRPCDDHVPVFRH